MVHHEPSAANLRQPKHRYPTPGGKPLLLWPPRFVSSRPWLGNKAVSGDEPNRAFRRYSRFSIVHTGKAAGAQR
jgi:hypothetical protein